ncbi:hypothetical protein BB381_00265 [Campylobacter pinnipediorum subsp. caledonicus]|nr:hypothetical protein BB381_00265 [Campylobacter pinnipediorum subsp. caledonicus]
MKQIPINLTQFKILKSVLNNFNNKRSITRQDILNTTDISKDNLSKTIKNGYLLENKLNKHLNSL